MHLLFISEVGRQPFNLSNLNNECLLVSLDDLIQELNLLLSLNRLRAVVLPHHAVLIVDQYPFLLYNVKFSL